MLILLPGHLAVSGVTTWAMRAVAGLRERGHAAGLVVHCRPGEEVPEFLQPYAVATVENAPGMDEMHRCRERVAEVYGEAIRSMFTQTGEPVVVAPNLHSECYAALAVLTRTHAEMFRVVSWIHADNDYDLAVSKQYEPMIHSFIPVSTELEAKCVELLPERRADVRHVAHGVVLPAECPARAPTDGRPLQLVYTGRLDVYQKRVGVLPILSKMLNKQGVLHELRIVGDGPEYEKLCNETRDLSCIRLTGSVLPNEIPSHLRWGDLWVLASRYEGQSVAMLEAMAQGCVPIITRVHSGANDAVTDTVSGRVVDADWYTSDIQIAKRMAAVISSLGPKAIRRMSEASYDTVARLYHQRHHLDALVHLTSHVVKMPARHWSDALPTAAGNEPRGAVPANAAARMRRCLQELEGKNVLIFGCGRHTEQLSSEIRDSRAHIVGIVDDNPALGGAERWGLPVHHTSDIEKMNATDLVISSYIHCETVYRRLKSLGLRLRIHKLYDETSS